MLSLFPLDVLDEICDLILDIPLDVLDEIWDLIESVSEEFLTYSSICQYATRIVQTLIRRRVSWRLFWVCTVCLHVCLFMGLMG